MASKMASYEMNADELFENVELSSDDEISDDDVFYDGEDEGDTKVLYDEDEETRQYIETLDEEIKKDKIISNLKNRMVKTEKAPIPEEPEIPSDERLVDAIHNKKKAGHKKPQQIVHIDDLVDKTTDTEKDRCLPLERGPKESDRDYKWRMILNCDVEDCGKHTYKAKMWALARQRNMDKGIFKDYAEGLSQEADVEKQMLTCRTVKKMIKYEKLKYRRNRKTLARKASQARKRGIEHEMREAMDTTYEAPAVQYLCCNICKDRDIEALFLPCGHNRYCIQCTDGLQNCPVCNRKICQRIKTMDARGLDLQVKNIQKNIMNRFLIEK